MKLFLRHVASLLIVAIIMFFSGNAVFVHSHDINGCHIVHSHPFSPGAHHTHSDQALNLIACANQTAHFAECVPAPTAELQISMQWTQLRTEPEHAVEKIDGRLYKQRGPPSAVGCRNN